jgi:hypothetical protein
VQDQRLVRRRRGDPADRRGPARDPKLLDVTSETLDLAIRAMARCQYWSEVAGLMERYVKSQGMFVVEKFVGHGIGQNMHEEPQVPNFVSKALRKNDIRLEPGLVLAIEPMVALGTKDVRTLDDGWTVETKDRGRQRPLRAHRGHDPRRPARPDLPSTIDRTPTREGSWAKSAPPATTLRDPPRDMYISPIRPLPRRSSATMTESEFQPDEDSIERQTDLRELQDRPPPGQGVRHLCESPPQTTARLTARVVAGGRTPRLVPHASASRRIEGCLVSWVWISRTTSAR